MIKYLTFADKAQEKEIAYVSASRISKFDAKQNKKEREKERKAEGKKRNGKARKEHYKKINKKLGGTLTPKKKKTPKNIPRTKKKITIKMKEIEEDVDEENEIKKRIDAGEDIPVGRRNTIMGYAFEKRKMALDRTRKSLEKGEEVADWALRQYNQELMKSIGKTIRKS
tara:strand:- start:1276 stop:1782 length:507 start_codon:yes stop_codon:yes gene_type:complete